MPWKEKTQVSERIEFIYDYRCGLFTMTELCARYGISRKTGYKWVERFQRAGPSGLEDHSRAPKKCPHRTPEALVEAILALRRAHPTWGPKKLISVLKRRDPAQAWPAPSTAGEVLKRHGLIQPRRRRRRGPHPGRPQLRFEKPNDLWTVDFKGDFLTGDRQRCYPLTAVDRWSRFVLDVSGQRSTSSEPVRQRFEVLFREYGLPLGILSDNGPPFSSQAIGGLSRLSVWWLKLGISPFLTEPGHPEQNGAHERMHRDLKAETARPPAGSPLAQQKRFDRFRWVFNEERPHEALDLTPPADHYTPSPRQMPETLAEAEYPGHFEVRRVRQSGEVKWQGRRYYLSECLAKETVGFEEVDDGVWSIYFTTKLLGRFDERTRKIHPGAPERSHAGGRRDA